jgi:hypothetical protein
MAKQTINVGNTANDRTGDPLRIAFQKTNNNFTEVYTAIDSMGSIDREWIGSFATYNVVEWNSGSTVEIEATPFETTSLVTSDARTDSNQIFFVWNLDFIDNVWNGYNTELGEGQAYSISFDNGVTWFSVERSGYSFNETFYFNVPYNVEGQYTFTYTEGQSVLMRYNRGSIAEIWFDIADAPVSANNITSVDMSVFVYAKIGELSTKMLRPNYRFANTLYNDDTGEGGINSGANVWFGSGIVEDEIEMSIRRSNEPADAGRIYARFDGGFTGTMEFYWNAKLYTFAENVAG